MADVQRGPVSLVIGTAGHIDHGKTALVKALTGIDADRLPEEKRRGITIDLGFASLELRAADGTPLSLSFVDVPGHHAFIRNMLAGAGGIDCVMLVISAEEGVKPQTEEHLAICTLLGIGRGLTVITKADAVSHERLQQVCREVEEWIAPTFLQGAPILAVSAFDGAGLPELRRELAQLATDLPARSVDGLARLPLDRAFSMRGFGTVVTGTLQSGEIRPGETLALEPGGRKVRVRGVQVHGKEALVARAGSRVALNLASLDVGDVHRGDMLVPPATLAATDTIDVEITLLPGAARLKHRARVRVHAFTAEALATIALYDYRPIAPGQPVIARLRLTHAMLVSPGDRFVLRQPSPAATMGGGRVLDAHPLPKTKKGQALAWLQQVQHANADQQLLLRVQRRGTTGMDVHELVRETGLAPETLRSLAAPLIGTQLVMAGVAGGTEERLITAPALEAATALVTTAVSRAGSIKRSELRSQTGLQEQVFASVLTRLFETKKLQASGEAVTLFGAGKQISETDQGRLAAIERAYQTAGLTAPLLRDVAAPLRLTEADLRRLMTLLLRDGTLVKLGNAKLGSDDLYMHRDALVGLQQKIRQLRGQALDVVRFKQITGLSRKYAIPLLEHLDRQHITRKQGESRIVL